MASPFYTAEHEAYREVVRRFVEKEIEPYAHEWDEAGGFPRMLYEKAAAIGLLGLGFPEEYGGTEVDNFMWIVAVQELARAGAGGVSPSLNSPRTAPSSATIARSCPCQASAPGRVKMLGLPARLWLEHYAGVFDTVEINNTFYRPGDPKAAAGWVARVAENADFKFTAKDGTSGAMR